MKSTILSLLIAAIFLGPSCVPQKKYLSMKNELGTNLVNCNDEAKKYASERDSYKAESEKYQMEAEKLNALFNLRLEQIEELKTQINDLKIYRDKQLIQVGDLTVLSQTANENITKSLSQLEKKDKYIHLLQEARTKADSINLVLALNLKSVLKDGIEDQDIEIKVDKTVVFINLSDKMLFLSGSSDLTSRANEILEKIAKIVSSRADVDVMVEGYTDNVPMKNNKCITDNWDLSVKRSTAVVRVLQNAYGINPNKLIAAGRGEYNALADNSTEAGRATNRRTRIIILPKLNQFYDLLNPANMED